MPNIRNATAFAKILGHEERNRTLYSVANYVPIKRRNIGADEHESQFVFDIIHQQQHGYQPDDHSTDTTAPIAVNFALLHVFGRQFAPRYRDLRDKVPRP